LKPLEEKALTLPNAAVADLMRAVLDRGGLFGFRARGTSMTPFLRDGDTLTIAPLAVESPRIGDVLAFSYPTGNGSRLVVHRLVGRRGRNLVLQGDASGSTPEIISSEDILGRLVKVVRKGEHVRLGLGPERGLIAWLSCTGVLWGLVWPMWCQVRKILAASMLWKIPSFIY